MERITLVGGGLAGSLLSIYLARRGFKVDIFERRPDMRKNKIAAGRSINLALSTRGINALEKAGLAKEVLADGIPMHGRMMHSVAGELTFQPYGKEGQSIYSVSRGRLNILLLELADHDENISLHFNQRCVSVDAENTTAVFEDENGKQTTFTSDRIIGTDGAFAATRDSMLHTERFNYSQSFLSYGYKELTIPAMAGGAFAMEKNALHIWPRGDFMMIGLPNPDGSFTCTLFFPYEGNESFAALKTKDQAEAFFKLRFPDATNLMPGLLEDFFSNPTGSLVTIKCFPWVIEDKLALLGDAAHAVVPFYGQGMNCAFEDCVILDECIEKHFPDWNKIFDVYQDLRKPNADAIADLAVQNFEEMRSKVGDKEFLHRKHIEHDLADLYPEHFKSQYELVTFTNQPYVNAIEQGRNNDRLLDKIISGGLEHKLSDGKFMLQLLQNRT